MGRKDAQKEQLNDYSNQGRVRCSKPDIKCSGSPLSTAEASSCNGNKHVKSQAFLMALLKSASVSFESLEC